MKRFGEFEDTILDSSEIMKKAGKVIIGNIGKIIALFVSVLMIAVTFTDITFSGVFTDGFASSLMLLITSSYIIYFSLEDSGEKCGEETEEYKKAMARYDSLREKIGGEDIEELRIFCINYAEKELEFRRKNALLSKGLSEDMITRYIEGESFGKRTDKLLRKISEIKPMPLSPKMLLCREKDTSRSELENPEKRKIPMLILKLIPSTLCMVVTLSVMLTAKEGLTGADILNSILKLSALPMIGFKGYSAGYSYAKHSLSLWSETKANILEDYLKEKQ